MVLAICVIMVIGKYADKMSPKVTVPAVFFFNSAIFFVSYFSDPGTLAFYIIMPLFNVGLMSSVVILLSYSNIMIPIEIRGGMSSLRIIWAQFNLLIFTLVANHVYQIDPAYPWILISATSGLFGILSIVLAKYDYIGDPLNN